MKLLLCLALALVTFQETVDFKERIKTFRNHKRFAVEYDRFKDVTDIRVGSFYVKNQRRSHYLDMSAVVTFQGRQPRESVNRVYMYFTGPSARLFGNVFVLIDGKRIEIAEPDQLSTGLYYGRPSAMVTMQRETFELLARSKSAEMQVGTAEIKFEDEHLQAFRDLLSLLDPPGSGKKP